MNGARDVPRSVHWFNNPKHYFPAVIFLPNHPRLNIFLLHLFASIKFVQFVSANHVAKRPIFRNPILVQFFIQRGPLRDLYDKVVAGERISEADALRLFESKDLNAVGAIADFARQKKVGSRASYIVNRYINYSNYCILSCQFCSFARKKSDADGFQFSVDEIVQKAREALQLGITELHIVGGLHPSLPFSYYVDMLKSLKALDPRLQLKCFTAIEILHLAWLAKKTLEATLRELKAAGLESLTGGGAEIFR